MSHVLLKPSMTEYSCSSWASNAPLPKYMLQANLRAAKQALRRRGDDATARSIRLNGRRNDLEDQCIRFAKVIEIAMLDHQHHISSSQLSYRSHKIDDQVKRMFDKVLKWIRKNSLKIADKVSKYKNKSINFHDYQTTIQK